MFFEREIIFFLIIFFEIYFFNLSTFFCTFFFYIKILVGTKVEKLMLTPSNVINMKINDCEMKMQEHEMQLHKHLNHLYQARKQSDAIASHIITHYDFRKLFGLEYKKLKVLQKLNGVNFNEKRRIKEELETFEVQKADIVATTLNSSATLGRYSSNNDITFQVCVVDEAGQATELETLIPLQHNCLSIVLCGDPKQLPATVMSESAKKHLVRD